MAYCTEAQVEAKIQQLVDTTTTPTAAETQGFIDETTGELNIYLTNAGVSLPVSDANLLLMLQKYCSYESAYQVLVTFFGNVIDVENSQADYYHQQYLSFLEELKNNKEIFQGGGVASGTYNLDNNVTDGTYTENEVNDLMLDNRIDV